MKIMTMMKTFSLLTFLVLAPFAAMAQGMCAPTGDVMKSFAEHSMIETVRMISDEDVFQIFESTKESGFAVVKTASNTGLTCLMLVGEQIIYRQKKADTY